jgi:hypothetical protein
MDGGRSLISAMGIVRVSVVRLCSTRLKTLSASSVGGPPVVVGPTSSQGHRRVLVKSVGSIGPTSVPNRYIYVSTLMHIKIIYIKEIKN